MTNTTGVAQSIEQLLYGLADFAGEVDFLFSGTST
jgi:hypothetical protein